MKKLIVSVLAIASMVACMNDEIVSVQKGNAIAFDSFVENTTRADKAQDPSTTTGTISAFDVWGFMDQTNGILFDGEDVTGSQGAFTYTNTQYWLPGHDYYFAALAPMNSDNWTLNTEAANFYGAGILNFLNINGTEDLLYAATALEDVSDNPGAVKFQFHHLLSKVKFTFENGFTNPYNTIVVRDVKMTAPLGGSINLAVENWWDNDDWNLTADKVSLAFGDAGEIKQGKKQESANERFTIPANKEQEYVVTFLVDLYMGDLFAETYEQTVSVKGIALDMGKAYNFKATIDQTNIDQDGALEPIVFDVEEVDQWVPAGDEDVYVGETVGVADATELLAAIADPEVSAVVLTQDIDLSTTTITRADDEAVVIEKEFFTIDGNGNTLTYKGSNRVIDFIKGDVVKNATIKDLTINITSSYCERGINFNNTNGSLLVENVTFVGTAPTYAINFPSSSNGATVTIKDSKLVGNIALNVWGKDMTINAYNTEFVSVDNNTVEDYAAVKLNNDGSVVAEGTVINIEGGKIIALDENDEPSKSTYNATDTGVINVSETTEVTGFAWEQVAIVEYGTSQFYGMGSLQDAIDKVVKDNNGKVRLTKNIELTKGVNVPKGANVEINLNGKTITGIDNTETNYEVLKNQGTLLLKNGTMTVKASINSGWNRYSAVIANAVGGNLTVEDVNVEHRGGTDMAYGIDNLTNGKGTSAVTTIKNSTVKSPYRAVRQFLNGVEATNELYVKSGAKLIGTNKSIFFHDPSKNANTGKLVVEAGAELNGDVYLFVTAGSTEWPVEVSIAESALVGESQVLSGNVPAGYIVINENGTYKVVEAVAADSQSALNDAVKEGGYVALEAGNYTMPAVNGQELTICGGEDVVITINKPAMHGSDITFDGVTIKGSGYSTGVQHVNTVTYRNAKVVGEMCLYGEKVVFDGCTFELNSQYIWVYGAKVAEFKNCVFNTNGKAILIYNEGAGANTVTVEGCTFNATAGAKAGAIANQNCAAIEIDNFQSSGVGVAHKLTTANNTVGANFSGEWRIKNYVSGNVINVNGVDYTQIAVDGKLMTIDANKNVTVL